MSWMDSWSRPSSNSTVPAPLYLREGVHTPYCHTCGRVMNSKKQPAKKQNSGNPIKYCSDRCRSHKPGPKDRHIERTIAALLNAEPESGIEKTAARSRVVKGDPRLIITCEEIEEIVFGSRFDPEKTHGRRRNRKPRAIGDPKAEWKSVDMESDPDGSSDTSDEDEQDEDEAPAKAMSKMALSETASVTASDTEPDGDAKDNEDSGGVPLTTAANTNFNITHIRPNQEDSEINFSAGGGERSRTEKITESEADLEKRRQGARRAEEREMVRRAARRVVVFGIEVPKREDPTVGGGGVKKAKGGKGKRAKKGDESEEEDEESKTTETRKAEAIMASMVVEPSFAKGNWSIRWRE